MVSEFIFGCYKYCYIVLLDNTTLGTLFLGRHFVFLEVI
jgi:hypothetical protein